MLHQVLDILPGAVKKSGCRCCVDQIIPDITAEGFLCDGQRDPFFAEYRGGNMTIFIHPKSVSACLQCKPGESPWILCQAGRLPFSKKSGDKAWCPMQDASKSSTCSKNLLQGGGMKVLRDYLKER